MKKVSTMQEAWNMVNTLIDWDYEHDTQASQNAGHPIYYSTRKGHNAWISDLGNRLEINTPDGKSVNIWVEDEKKEVPHHFEIQVKTSKFFFSYECTTAYEAYQAIEDAVITFNMNVDMDKMMETLINMKNEKTLSFENKWFIIKWKEGEV